jgi:hypothetical protein
MFLYKVTGNTFSFPFLKTATLTTSLGRLVLKKPFRSANFVISVLSIRFIISPLCMPALSAPYSF